MPASIVWIALAESELISGWWGEAQLEPWPGGTFRIALQLGDGTHEVAGRVARIEEPVSLVLDTDEFGDMAFTLEAVAGGTRGASTVLSIALDSYPAAAQAPVGPVAAEPVDVAVRARWDAHITNLVFLLHGHPADWGVAAVQRRTGL
jgi:uncharacterized protein YndB with AHSA1/START domain